MQRHIIHLSVPAARSYADSIDEYKPTCEEDVYIKKEGYVSFYEKTAAEQIKEIYARARNLLLVEQKNVLFSTIQYHFVGAEYMIQGRQHAISQKDVKTIEVYLCAISHEFPNSRLLPGTIAVLFPINSLEDLEKVELQIKTSCARLMAAELHAAGLTELQIKDFKPKDYEKNVCLVYLELYYLNQLKQTITESLSRGIDYFKTHHCQVLMNLFYYAEQVVDGKWICKTYAKKAPSHELKSLVQEEEKELYQASPTIWSPGDCTDSPLIDKERPHRFKVVICREELVEQLLEQKCREIKDEYPKYWVSEFPSTDDYTPSSGWTILLNKVSKPSLIQQPLTSGEFKSSYNCKLFINDLTAASLTLEEIPSVRYEAGNPILITPPSAAPKGRGISKRKEKEVKKSKKEKKEEKDEKDEKKKPSRAKKRKGIALKYAEDDEENDESRKRSRLDPSASLSTPISFFKLPKGSVTKHQLTASDKDTDEEKRISSAWGVNLADLPLSPSEQQEVKCFAEEYIKFIQTDKITKTLDILTKIMNNKWKCGAENYLHSEAMPVRDASNFCVNNLYAPKFGLALIASFGSLFCSLSKKIPTDVKSNASTFVGFAYQFDRIEEDRTNAIVLFGLIKKNETALTPKATQFAYYFLVHLFSTLKKLLIKNHLKKSVPTKILITKEWQQKIKLELKTIASTFSREDRINLQRLLVRINILPGPFVSANGCVGYCSTIASKDPVRDFNNLFSRDFIQSIKKLYLTSRQQIEIMEGDKTIKQYWFFIHEKAEGKIATPESTAKMHYLFSQLALIAFYEPPSTHHLSAEDKEVLKLKASKILIGILQEKLYYFQDLLMRVQKEELQCNDGYWGWFVPNNKWESYKNFRHLFIPPGGKAYRSAFKDENFPDCKDLFSYRIDELAKKEGKNKYQFRIFVHLDGEKTETPIASEKAAYLLHQLIFQISQVIIENTKKTSIRPPNNTMPLSSVIQIENTAEEETKEEKKEEEMKGTPAAEAIPQTSKTPLQHHALLSYLPTPKPELESSSSLTLT